MDDINSNSDSSIELDSDASKSEFHLVYQSFFHSRFKIEKIQNLISAQKNLIDLFLQSRRKYFKYVFFISDLADQCEKIHF